MFRKILLSLLLIGCLSVTKPQEEIDFYCFNENLKVFIPYQRVEVLKRFKRANVVLCHGKYNDQNQWISDPDPDTYRSRVMQDWADDIKKVDNTKPLVFLVCNEKGAILHGKGVFYFKACMWSLPDDRIPLTCYSYKWGQYVTIDHETKRNFGNAGSIWEAVRAEANP